MLLCRFSLLIATVLISRVNAQKQEIGCTNLRNLTFGNQQNYYLVCEFQKVKFSMGKTLVLRNDSKNYGYQKLRVKFSNSNVQFIPTVIFEEFRRVEVLEMNEIGLRNIFQQTFHFADYLRVLHAYGNKITNLLSYAFVGCKQLEYLDLSSNKISNINFAAFSGLESLKELSLSNNRITILDENTFMELKNLSWIWLDRNTIQIISVNLLISSQQLEGLYLNDNSISSISPILFDKLPRLKFLFLNENNCTNSNFINTIVSQNAYVKKSLADCYKTHRTIVPDEDDRYRLKSILRDAEKANSQCEKDKAVLIEKLENTRQQLNNLQYKNGK